MNEPVWKHLKIYCLLLMTGCASNDYSKSNHSYQDPLPDYWDSYYYERNHYNQLDRIERRHKKRLDKIEKELLEVKPRPVVKGHRPIQDDQEVRTKRK